MGSITTNKASGGDGILAELFQILKDDVVEVPHSICPQICKTQQWPQDWKRSVFIPIPKKANAKECSNYCTIALISHTSKVLLKILQARLPHYMNCELPDVQAGFRKDRETCIKSYMKRVASPGSMHDTGCLGLVHWDNPEGWYGEGGGRRVQDGEHIYTHG